MVNSADERARPWRLVFDGRPAAANGRRGVTLVELLVTVGIVVLLAAVSIPTFRGLSQGRLVREAARNVSVSIGVGQMAAMSTGKPAGVLIQRDSTVPQAGTVIYQVQTPDSYSGDQTTSTCIVQQWPAYNPIWPTGTMVVKLMFKPGDVSYPKIQLGDTIQIGLSGNWWGPFRIVADPNHSGGSATWPYDFPVDTHNFIMLNQPSDPTTGYMTNYLLTAVYLPMSGPLTLPSTFPPVTQADLTQNASQYQQNTALWLRTFETPPRTNPPNSAPLPAVLNPMSFQVTRRATATSAAPLRLDGRAAIDLAFSGTDTGDPTTSGSTTDTLSFQSTGGDTSPVMILFSPTGELNSIWVANVQWLYRNPIYLLVGRRDRVALGSPPSTTPTAEDGLWNWQDTNNLWVTIKPSTGLVTTSEIKVPQTSDPFISAYSSTLSLANDYKDSRVYAAQGQTTGGH